jgi:hypothetical protein
MSVETPTFVSWKNTSQKGTPSLVSASITRPLNVMDWASMDNEMAMRGRSENIWYNLGISMFF